MRKRTILSVTLLGAMLLTWMQGTPARAQELNAKVTINRSKVSNTKGDVFPSLEKKITDLLNNTKWTELKLKESERIQCTFNITINTYSDTDNSFVASLLVTSSRPVYGANYMTTAFSNNDTQFNFKFQEFDELEFRPEQINNQLVALLAYYAYIIIGADLDTMAPKGGTEVLQKAEEVVSAGQTLDYPGWKAFDDSKNRFGLINDWLDGSMEGYRQMLYKYHRSGLDQMADDADKGRAAIVEALTLLDTANKAKTQSHLPQLFSAYKREELVNIFAKNGTAEEKQQAYEILFSIDPSQGNNWDKLKK